MRVNEINASFFWHDYETWGVNPQKDFPCQFAGIRTDMDLNIIDKPMMIYSQIPSDYLPTPKACMVTGITPQLSLKKGLTEAEFIKRIHKQFSQANTCVVGFNNLRFDDEVTRNTLYRNFYDPYAREWKNGNSRWDLIDMVRACYALRPEGINWPTNEEGVPNFKLQNLTAENDIQHEGAHDAMADVYATIAVAKLIKKAQPKLFSYLLELRSKQNVAALIDCESITPLVHVSSKISTIHGCCSWIAPICYHPSNKNAVIVLNLAIDPGPLLTLTSEQIIEKLYISNDMLAEGEQRLPIKLVHINKCPVVAPAKTLNKENALRLGIDRTACLENLAKIRANSDLKDKLLKAFSTSPERPDLDPEHALYSGGFFSDQDKHLIESVRQADENTLTDLSLAFTDPRLSTLLFRYKARNFPQTLNQKEVEQWQHHRKFRMLDETSPASINMHDYLQEIEDLSQQYAQNPEKLTVLQALYEYAQTL
jgi:exodeoxyribonuclease-1